jgi:hypothetical protein
LPYSSWGRPPSPQGVVLALTATALRCAALAAATPPRTATSPSVATHRQREVRVREPQNSSAVQPPKHRQSPLSVQHGGGRRAAPPLALDSASQPHFRPAKVCDSGTKQPESLAWTTAHHRRSKRLHRLGNVRHAESCAACTQRSLKRIPKCERSLNLLSKLRHCRAHGRGVHALAIRPVSSLL